jgi:hypothetical protein
MALIGIYEDITDESESTDFLVESLHFNLWILPLGAAISTIWKNRSPYAYFVDIGLRLKLRSGSKVSKIDMYLPGKPDIEKSFVDLHDIVLNEKVNDLIFGTEVTSRNHSIKYTRNGVEIHDDVCKISSLKRIGAPNSGRHQLTLTSAAFADTDDKTLYMRFRYRCADASDLLISKGWGFAKRGFIIDLRVNDIRESINFYKENSPTRMRKVGELNAFVVCSTLYLPLLDSPMFHYSRILEPGAWDEYLQSCKPYDGANKLVIHQWRGSDITYQKPFRAFAHLHKEFGWLILTMYLLGLLTPVILTQLAKLY